MQEHQKITAIQDWGWSFGLLKLSIKHGDILKQAEEAMVNSEQTDFILATHDNSISSKLNSKYPEIQSDLHFQTKGKVFPPGTVLQTICPNGKIIFHAGFHAPSDWYNKDDAENLLAEHMDRIQECVEIIIDQCIEKKVRSVGFPLIGCGRFGLPKEVFASVFFESIIRKARECESTLEVVLYASKSSYTEIVARNGTQCMASHLNIGTPLLNPAGGHPLVSSLRNRVRKSSDQMSEERELLRFSEMSLHVDMAVFAEHANFSKCRLMDILNRPSVSLTFGHIVDLIVAITKEQKFDKPGWVADRAEKLKIKCIRTAISRLNKDRNDFAHHAKPREIDGIIEDVELVFGPTSLPQEWENFSGNLWIKKFSGGIGLLSGYTPEKNKVSWLIPETREKVHKINPPCKIP